MLPMFTGTNCCHKDVDPPPPALAPPRWLAGPRRRPSGDPWVPAAPRMMRHASTSKKYISPLQVCMADGDHRYSMILLSSATLWAAQPALSENGHHGRRCHRRKAPLPRSPSLSPAQHLQIPTPGSDQMQMQNGNSRGMCESLPL